MRPCRVTLKPCAIPSLSTRSLRYLHEIEVHGGVRAAADALSINGSVISRQVAQLERVHGVALLERRGRRVTLTEIGLSLVEHFRESARRDAEMLAQLEDYRGLRRGRLEIGGMARVSSKSCSPLCSRQFSLQFPDIVVELRAGRPPRSSPWSVTTRSISACARAAAAIRPFARGLFAPRRCARSSVRSTYWRANGESASNNWPGQRLIFMPARFGVQQYLDSLIRAERLNLTPAYRCDLFSAAQAIAAAGLGVAFMSTDAARQYLDAGKLVAARN